MLTEQLRELQAAGVVRRTVLAGGSAGVQYRLTDAGLALGPALTALHEWGARYAGEHGIPVDPPVGMPGDSRGPTIGG